MPVFEKKPKPKYKSFNEGEVSQKKEEIEENINSNIHPSNSNKVLKEKKEKISISSKTKQTLAKFSSYAGIFSLIKSTGNACKGIAANPFLMILGIGLIAASIGIFLWSLFN